MKNQLVLELIIAISLTLSASVAPAFAQTSSAPDAPVSQTAASAVPAAVSTPEARDWAIDATTSVPFRGFNIQTGSQDPQTQDPLGSISYSPSPSLEGSLFLSYKNYGFSYRHTLAAADLDTKTGLPPSMNEEYRFNLFLDRHLFELSHQHLVGMATEIDTDKKGVSTHIARPDIAFNDYRARWMSGVALWGADKPNTLANYYDSAEMSAGSDVSVDLLYQAQVMQQRLSADSPFIPEQRKAVFGMGASLRDVSSTGLGAGVGGGVTVKMYSKSFFSLAGLIGGNFNVTKAAYNDHEEDASGFGSFLSARMSVRWVFGRNDSQNMGVRLLVDSWMIPVRDEKVASTDSAISLNYGARF